MKSTNKMKTNVLFFILFISCLQLPAQDSLLKKISIKLQYFAEENKSMYLLATAKTKINGRFKSLHGISMTAFLDEEVSAKLIDSAVTDENGQVKLFLPVRLKDLWTSNPGHTFIVNSKENDSTRSGQGELTILKSKLVLDTLSDDQTRKIKVTAFVATVKGWEPIKGLEIKFGVQRLGGILKVTEEDLYTTDSSGSFIAQIKDTLIPGNEEGHIVLAARVEDNDTYGNLLVTKEAAWGLPTHQDDNFFDQRTLWSTRFRTPYWLLFIVYGMAIGIWGTIIIVLSSLVKTIRLGKE
jgi:hypothetical protein